MSQTPKSALALRLRLLRVASGMKQDEIATQLGIGRSAYTYYESSRSKPDYDSLIRLAKMFHVSIDYLVGMSNFPDVSGRVQVADDATEGSQIAETTFGMLTAEERHMLCIYRQLSEDGQAEILQEIQKKVGR